MPSTLGIDEAGRGPVLGPMVMAAVCLDTRGARLLTRAGLRDSKRFGATAKGRQRRTELAGMVIELAAHVEVRVVDVADIDRRVRCKQLNALEREVAEELIGRAPRADRIIADGKRMFGPLAARHANLEALDRAESRHASVAAASVVAKTRRDQIIEDILARYRPLFGDIRGNGYGNEATRRFLRAYARRFGCLPPEARRSWPYAYLEDILGVGFDPYAGTADPLVGQIRLL